MNGLNLLNGVCLFFGGLLAGIELAIHYGVLGPIATLDERSQLQLRQGLVRKLRVFVPAFFLPTLVSGAALTYLAGTNAGFGYRWVGLCGLFVWVQLRVAGTVPINKATLSWSLSAPPPDWKQRVARAERFHDVGVLAVVLCFACFLASTVTQMEFV